MPENRDDVNLGNPANARRDAEERNDAKVTKSDHPVSELAGAKAGADDLYDDTVAVGREKDERGRSANGGTVPVVIPAAAAGQAGGGMPGIPVVAPVTFDMKSEIERDSDIDEMPGEPTTHVDPLSGDTGMHPVGVGVGATAGGAVAGAVAGLAAGAVGGPLGAAFGAALGTTLGAIGGGYAGKHIAEKVHPTTEDHCLRKLHATRPYVPKGALYEEWEPAYCFGVQMREWLIDKTWEESEEMIRSGWQQSPGGQKMSWEQARPAICDAWDQLTPEPDEGEVSEEEKERD